MINCNDTYDFLKKSWRGFSEFSRANWPTAWDFPQFQDIITFFLFSYAFVEGHLLHYSGA
jgi:hypothetical protein